MVGPAGMTSFGYADLEQAISPAPAGRYLRSTIDSITGRPDPDAALALYEHNVDVGAAAWRTIGDVEIVLRNILADAISCHHATIRSNPTHRWYDDPPWFVSGRWFTSDTVSSIRSAMKRAKDPGPGPAPRPGEGRVVAESTLGFWRYLLIARYEHTLWNPAIRSRFPALSHLSGSDSRKAVHARMEKLNYLRNRVAHHEPIYEPFALPGHPNRIDTVTTLDEAIEMVSWSNPAAAGWIGARSSYVAVVTARPAIPLAGGS
jgi:hypothetical protein